MIYHLLDDELFTTLDILTEDEFRDDPDKDADPRYRQVLLEGYSRYPF